MNEIIDDDISELEGKTNYLLFYFTASWCGPCQRIKPLIEEIASKVNDSLLEIYKIDIDSNSELVDNFNIRSVPTLILIKDLKNIANYSGSNKSKIAELFKNIS